MYALAAPGTWYLMIQVEQLLPIFPLFFPRKAEKQEKHVTFHTSDTLTFCIDVKRQREEILTLRYSSRKN